MKHSIFNPPAAFAPGFVSTVDRSAMVAGRLGGSRWTAVGGGRTDIDGPTLLATVSLASPALRPCVGDVGEVEIPLFSYINVTGAVAFQQYRIDPSTKTVSFDPVPDLGEMLEPEYRVRTPLPEAPLHVRPMRAEEIPAGEDSYWTASDTFLGSEAALRICGEPVFIDDIAPRAPGFRYFAGIGYELYDGGDDGLLRGEALFFGEVASYYFVSPDWRTVHVFCQPT